MSHPERPRPLIPSDSCKTIPISIVLDGVEVTGQIVFLNSTDLQVAILSPVSGFGAPCRSVELRNTTIWPINTVEVSDGNRLARIRGDQRTWSLGLDAGVLRVAPRPGSAGWTLRCRR